MGLDMHLQSKKQMKKNLGTVLLIGANLTLYTLGLFETSKMEWMIARGIKCQKTH